MTLNEIKKELYKSKVAAHLHTVNKSGLMYKAVIAMNPITFIVPLDEIGDATFNYVESAHLLIRYIVQ